MHKRPSPQAPFITPTNELQAEFKEVIMRKAIMVFCLVFSVALLASSTAFAKSGSSSSMMGESQSMMGSEGGAMFQHPQRLSQLIGSDVINNAGEELGKVRDLIADEDGKINYLVLARGGMMGVGADLVAIPTAAVQPRITKDGKCSINLDKKTLAKAPTFASSSYPDFSNKHWQEQVRGYFSGEGQHPADKGMTPENNKMAPPSKEDSGY